MAVERAFISAEAPTARRAGAGGRPCQGLWHHRSARRPKVAFLAAHYEVDFSEHYLGEPLAERGYGFLGWNTRYRGNGAYFSLDRALEDIGVGVAWLRERAGAEVVVLLGNSGGASLMAAYQAEAPSLGLPGGDLFVSLNAHPGRPDVLTAWLDPSVADEADPTSTEADLDLFAPGREPPYPEDFLCRYRRAQAARNERLTAWAQSELERLAGAGHDDRVFSVARTWADPRFLDLTLDPSDRVAGCYAGDPRRANRGAFGLAAATTLRSWLEMWSLSESRCRAAPHLRRLGLPALVVQSTADQGCFPSDARSIHDCLGSPDKGLEWVAGDHYLRHPPDARAAVADLLASWVAERASP